MLDPHPFVTILTINFGQTEDTLRLLDNLKQLRFPLNKIDILIIDNIAGITNKNKFQHWILNNQKKFKKIKYYHQPKNPGLSLSLNFALSKVSKQSEFLWRLDNDTLVEPDALAQLLSTVSSNRVGIAGSRTLILIGNQKTNQFLDGGWIFCWPIGYAIKMDTPIPKLTDYCTGASFLVRMTAVRELGYLADPVFYAYFEDADFCWQVKKLGYQVWYQPRSIVYHKFSQDGLTSAFKVSLMTRNRVIFMRKNARTWLPIFIPAFLLYGPLSLAFYVPNKKDFLPTLRVFLKSFIEGLTSSLNKPMVIGQ